ncbi:molybdopterin-dependent oxidoreductase [Thermococcus sp.]|uniref:molybdopterin-dependent oxidoreductase n=1 Tax=Thermococcus sp. TaxID=35749 RepID=UPI00263511BE|nr:molybdopterin-dependent oxidoreductase [Thermococcus sp.]
MKKLAFALLILLILALGTYWGWSGEKGSSEKSSATLEEKGTNEKTISGPVIAITGLVERPYNITLSELREMSSRKVHAVLYCVSAPNKPLKNGTWVGVPLKYLLQRAGIKKNAVKVALYASDGYTTDLRVKDVLADGDIIVAYEFNGKPIEPRLIVPGRWGYKWIKHLTKIELVDYDFKGRWESAGYPDDAYIENEANPWR